MFSDLVVEKFAGIPSSSLSENCVLFCVSECS